MSGENKEQNEPRAKIKLNAVSPKQCNVLA